MKIILAILVIVFINCDVANTVDTKDTVIGDFAPVKVGNVWVYTSESQRGDPMAGILGTYYSYSTKLFLSINDQSSSGDSMFYTASLQETGKVIKDYFKYNDSQKINIHQKDTLSIDSTFLFSFYELNDTFCLPHYLYNDCPIPFFVQHTIKVNNLSKVNDEYEWPIDTYYNAKYRANKGLSFYNYHTGGMVMHAYWVSRDINLTLESFNGEKVSVDP